MPPPSRTPRRSWNSTANACHACWSISCCGTTVRPGICCGCRSTRIAFRAFAARRGHSAARWSPRERATRFRPMPLDRARARPRSPLERSSDRDCRSSARIPRSASCSRRKSSLARIRTTSSISASRATSSTRCAMENGAPTVRGRLPRGWWWKRARRTWERPRFRVTCSPRCRARLFRVWRHSSWSGTPSRACSGRVPCGASRRENRSTLPSANPLAAR